MIRTTTGHPVRALRGAAVLLAFWLTYRGPGMRTAFDTAVAAVAGDFAPDGTAVARTGSARGHHRGTGTNRAGRTVPVARPPVAPASSAAR